MFWRYGVWFIIIGLFVLAALAWAIVGWARSRRVDEEVLLHEEERQWRAEDEARRKEAEGDG